MRNSIIKKEWTKVRTVESSLLSVWLTSREYMDSSRQELGVGFDNVIFEIEGNLATTFRIDEEQKKFSNEIASKLIFEKDFLKKTQKILLDSLFEFELIFDLPEKDFLTLKRLRNFYNLHNFFIPYYLSIIWAPNEIYKLESSQKTKDRVYKTCEELRKQTEPILGKIEVFINKAYEYLAVQEKVEKKLLANLLPEELLVFLQTKKLPSGKILEKRFKYCVLISNKKKNEIIYGKKAKSIITTILRADEELKEVKGIIANTGLVSGRVRIIITEKDIRKLKMGDILVTPMTRPEWLPFMKIASAFVTDAGGVLCHAAIVARELNKPCIIGTKIATKILTDGDLVQVDANSGIIKIL